MTSRCRRPLPACIWHARYILFCLGIALLFATLADGETSGVRSYYSWQWGGFSGSALTSAAASASGISLRSTHSSYASLTLATSANQWDSVTSSSASATAILSGVVYYDENSSDTRDTSDWGIRDATVLLTAANGDTQETTTAKDGSYSFDSLVSGDYTITLLTPSVQPETPCLGEITDASGNAIATGLGIVSGTSSIASIHLASGNTAVNYDFPQLKYPTNLLSKRLLLGSDPGLSHTTAAPPVSVPEPGTLTLLAVAGLSIGGFLWRSRREPQQFPG